jgi:hypothetical protein
MEQESDWLIFGLEGRRSLETAPKRGTTERAGTLSYITFSWPLPSPGHGLPWGLLLKSLREWLREWLWVNSYFVEGPEVLGLICAGKSHPARAVFGLDG